jgi:hypothetical protein
MFRRRPNVTVRVFTEIECSVFFEPRGSEYRLTPEDEVLVHFDPLADEHPDLEVTHHAKGLSLWLPKECRAFNKSGTEIQI